MELNITLKTGIFTYRSVVSREEFDTPVLAVALVTLGHRYRYRPSGPVRQILQL